MARVYRLSVVFAAIGLTGGIGSGKSTVARFFGELGVPVVDADRIAREVVEPGSDGLREVVAAFGPEVLAPDGTLDRGALAEIVFDDDHARRRLNSILHPRIGLLSMQRLAQLEGQGHPYAIYEAALLVENGSYRMLAGLIVVAASETAQLARTTARDEASEEAVRARIAAQLPLEKKIAVANWVIHNDGTLDELRARVQEVDRAIRERFGIEGGKT